ncbi:uncharacterized protein LOC106874881 isoform X1 [Octopus bimaculoides]|uniref:uncharacterized protein LOC106874881 isoform X1 n=1 Tax=Octopus bimaculoides TaxID=37653 RepID=UPI0022E86662|nr:uncharacterized protein LOC106874881 isoform X1 [Octopus bimaculoides]
MHLACLPVVRTTEEMKMAEQMRYPYTMSAKMMRFPWKYHWANARFLRYLTYAIIIASPLYIKIHKFANQPANWAKWNGIRAKREHTHFDPVKP